MTPTTEYFVAIDSVRAAEDNPRTTVGDVDELAASIKSLGVLQPLVVMAEGDGYTVVAGARRLAAARIAGLTEIPVVVRELDEVQRQEAMLIENLQRSDLTPLEEALAYQRLVTLGRSQRDLAKRIGRSQGTVSKRLSLLNLPETARRAIDVGKLSLEDAGHLTRLLDLPDAEELIEKALHLPSYQRLEDVVEGFVLKAERAVAAKAQLEELRKAGIRVLDQDAEYEPLDWLVDELQEKGITLDPEAHTSEPCHAVVISWSGSPDAVCTDPVRHGGDPITVADDQPGQSSLDEGAKEHQRKQAELKAAEEIRFAICQDACRRMPSKAATELILWALVDSTNDGPDYHLVHRMLDLPTPIVDADEGTEKVEVTDEWDEAWVAGVVAHAAISPTALARTALATALANGEQSLGWNRVANGRHFDFLRTLGYEPTPAEVERYDLKVPEEVGA